MRSSTPRRVLERGAELMQGGPLEARAAAVVIDGHQVLGSEHPQGRRGRAVHLALAGQRVGQLAVTEMGEALVLGRRDDLGALSRSDGVRAYLGDRRDVGEVGLGKCVGIAACGPATPILTACRDR